MKKNDRLRPIAQVVIVALFILIIVSGGTQLFLSPKRVAGWIKDRLPEYENLQVEFTKAQISFSGGIFPLFGIKVKDVRINYQDCETSLQLNAPYILVPFSITKAIQNDLDLGYFKAGEIDLQILRKENICMGTDDKNNVTVEEQEEIIKNLFKKKDYDKIFAQLREPFNKFRGMKIQKLSVLFPKETLLESPSASVKDIEKQMALSRVTGEEEGNDPELLEKLQVIEEAKRIEAKRLRLTYDQKAASILLSGGFRVLQPGFTDFKKLPLINLNLDLNQDKGLKLKSEIRYHEGRFYISSNYQKNLEALIFRWKTQDLPLSFFIRTLNLEDELSRINPHLVWLNGNGLLRLNYANNMQTSLLAKSLRLKGDLIDARTQDVLLGIRPEIKVLKPFRWRLDSLDLEQISDYLNYKGVRGVLRKAGKIRGTGTVKSFDQVSFDGGVKGLEFFFSKDGQRAYQKVKRAEMHIEYNPKSVAINFERLLMSKGEINGQASFKVTRNETQKKWQNWTFLASGTNLLFNDKVYNVFEFAPLPFSDFKIAVNGQNKDVKSIKVSGQAEHFKTRWGQFFNMTFLLTSREPKVLDLQIESEIFDINQSYINMADVIKKDRLENVSLKLGTDLETNSGHIRFISKDPDAPFAITSSKFSLKDGFRGTLTKSKKSFEIKGSNDKGYTVKDAAI